MKKRKTLDVSRLVVTDHAIEQFLDRCDIAYPSGIKEPIKALRTLLKQAVPCHLNRVSYENRLQRHKEFAKYYLSGIWRFVVIPENKKLILVTCELRNYELNRQAKLQKQHSITDINQYKHGKEDENGRTDTIDAERCFESVGTGGM